LGLTRKTDVRNMAGEGRQTTEIGLKKEDRQQK
jgi:hypothetical protein